MYGVKAAVTVDTNGHFEVGNENYSLSNVMTFDEIKGNSDWIKFDYIYFNISSANSINLSLSYLNSNVDGCDCGEKIVEFTANTTAGTVYFNLSGFSNGEYYDVLRDDIFYTRCVANASGGIYFSNSVWSDHTFSVLKACNCTGYEYGNWSFSEHLKNDILEEDWIESNSSIWYVNDSSSWWAGNSTYAFNATDSDFDVSILNNSGMNRTQLFGWCKINSSDSTNLFPMIIFNYANNDSFDAVLFRNDFVYLAHWNGTNLTDIASGLTWEEIDLMHQWTNLESQEYEEPAYLTVDGAYYKLLYNTYTGKVKFKYWNSQFMNEPAGWAVEYQHTDLSTNDSRCIGLGVWNPDSKIATVHFDLFNSWQLNYTVNTSASITLDGNTYARPHMPFPIINMSLVTEIAEYFNSTASGNFSAVDTIRDMMKDNITNVMNLESRMFEPTILEAADQNDTIYYYSCLYDEIKNFTEQVTGDDPPDWLYDEYLHVQVQMCTDGDFDNAGSGTYYDDMIIGIDVDNDGTWDSNDRIFWMGADGLRVQYNYYTSVTPVFNASIWLSDTDAVGNLHRYNSHVNYGFNLPLATLVKSNGDPLNVSDVFGLSIANMDDGSDVGVVWQNWNETTGESIHTEVTDTDVGSYFFNYTGEEGEHEFDIDSTILGRWGEGVIFGGDSFNESKELSYAMTIDVNWNDTVALTDETYCVINETIWVNNTGTGDLTDIWVNQTWWNCSCSDLNMTFVDSNLDDSNFTWYNDSCYWLIHNHTMTLSSSSSWSFWVVINITACPGTTVATATVNTSGNATELISDVQSDDGITFAWGFQPTIRIDYVYNPFGSTEVGILNMGFIMFGVLSIAIIGGYIMLTFFKKLEGDE